MTPQERAKNLVDRFRPHAKIWDCYNDRPYDENNAKACALIAVDELIKYAHVATECNASSYWQQVKAGIEKL